MHAPTMSLFDKSKSETIKQNKPTVAVATVGFSLSKKSLYVVAFLR